MSNVTSSRGVLEPASPNLRSEVEIVCRMAMAALPNSVVPWASYIDNYDLIRDKMAEVYPNLFTDFNKRVRVPGGFHLPIPPRERKWNTNTGRANFLLIDGLDEDEPMEGEDMFRLCTTRSHDQYNTTIYSNSDRYRGVYDGRMVLFMNADDMKERNIEPLSIVALETIAKDGIERRIKGLTVYPFQIPRGSLTGYYPELNPLLPLDHYDEIAGTPAAKSIPVRIIPQAKAA